MSAVKDHAGAGFILFAPDFRFLLVQDAKTKKWGFPKGHREPQDVSDLATARRELFEETGLQEGDYDVFEYPFRIVRGSSSYIFRYAMLKSLESQHILHFPRHEISAVQWLPLAACFINIECVDGNKYLRTWMADIVTTAPRRCVAVFQDFLMAYGLGVGAGALGVGGGVGDDTVRLTTAVIPVADC
jgi:8-oxo-dGTP pyrophosphatase MutT (NUDIX family)